MMTKPVAETRTTCSSTPFMSACSSVARTDTTQPSAPRLHALRSLYPASIAAPTRPTADRRQCGTETTSWDYQPRLPITDASWNKQSRPCSTQQTH
eukprot:112729-Pleurochrysis_carterae.AAC.2